MISNHPAEPLPQATSLPGTEGGAAQAPVDPRTPIEVASGGNGTINDPAGSDTKPPSPPPGIADLELLA